MNKIDKILMDYKNERTTLKVANQQVLDLLQGVKCPSHSEQQVKYIQWEDRWYCCICRDIIADTKDLL